MSTTHGQPGLSSDQRSTIQSTILSTRHTLENELRRQLEKYGIYENKRLPLEDLSHLSAEERHTRRTLDAAIERELESTEGDLERSITNYVREATKTYLNRFVALKTIEVRGLVEETITERPEYGNRSYMHHTVAEIAGELTNAPDDGFGAALDLAYQEIGAEIRMIFEESEHTAIDLDAQVREEVLDELDAIDDDAWESDEALGWVYQYFGEEEREEIDERVDEENYKIAGTDIATKTQIFTPRYIVEWMVDNSLGRTWLEMCEGRTNIGNEENCFNLAPLEDSLIERERKSVEEITVLDPACGSGHMLLYAFDVLYQMYLEEGEVPEKYIPREILHNNLYGIDIDSGAAQIAALSLYLKAKEKSPDVTIPMLNIVSADAVLINGARKEEVMSATQSELEKEILEQIWTSFDNIREWGSLVRIEDQIDELLDEYRETFESRGQAQFTTDGDLTTQSTFISGTEEETWDELKDRLMSNIRNLAEEALEQDDPIEEMFASEVGKTVELLDLLIHDYDVVVTNPPYLGSGKMNSQLKEFVKSNYTGKTDLYTAFIERSSDFTNSQGYVSMITMETFMFLYSYRGLRSELLNGEQFTEFLHIRNRDEGYLNTAFVFRSKEDYVPKTRFIRLVNDSKKEKRIETIIRNLRKGTKSNEVYDIDQDSFLNIGRQPFLYTFGSGLLSIFQKHDSLAQHAGLKTGLQTGDNEKFQRKWWEVPEESISQKYLWINQSGGKNLFYDSTDWLIEWEDDGARVKSHPRSSARNEDYYFSEGLNFRNFSNTFTARYQRSGEIFGDTAYFVSPESHDDYELLSYLCSSLSQFILEGLNPGLNFEVGDVKRLPVKHEHESSEELSEIAKTAVKRKEHKFSLIETKREFDGEQLINAINRFNYERDLVEADILVLQSLLSEIVFEEYGLDEELRSQIEHDFPLNYHTLAHVEKSGEIPDEYTFRKQIKTTSISDDKYAGLVDAIQSSEGDISELSSKNNISPYTVVNIRRNEESYSSDQKQEVAGRLLSYYLGEIFGRWDCLFQKPTVSNGILTFEPSREKGIESHIRQCFENSFDKPREIISKLENILDADIISWLRERFFRYHHVDEYKRRGQRIPIYWQLESSDGAFSCFLYYHEIDENMLPKLRGQYLDPRIDGLENELETLNAQISRDDPDKELLSRKEEVQNDLDDIKEFRETIDKMIDDGVTVDVERGIWENIKEWDQYEVLKTGLPKLKSSYSR